MKKTLFAIALAAVGLAAVPAAFAQTASAPTAQQGWYVGAEAGYGQVNKGPYDSQGSYIGGVKGGYRFAINPETSVGVEAGYEYLGFIDAKGANDVSSLRGRLHGPTLGANLRWNFNPSWYAEVRAGAFYAQGQGLTNTYATGYDRFERVRPYAGVGVGYNINQNFSLGLNYNYYDGASKGGDQGVQLQTNAVTVAAEYRF
ncbi:outer membrane protein [Dyella acidiphila]|uniref:Porin family protein n=1 Tax=Dyella acidiphila TaxID=2775866 RepID=A0ABR9G4M9_9GAMM|nr:porin family protein [Dyella acidiphila]MBE1159011.1 porin family protein [Dyella acidiphila]